VTDGVRQYPLIEVIAEFHFLPEVWADDLPDILYEKLKGDLPVRKAVDKFETKIELSVDTHAQSSTKIIRHQFFTSDETKLIQIDKQLLAVNHVRPYTSWEEYYPLIARTLEAFHSVRPAAEFGKVVLQYINRIEIPGVTVDINDYFEFRPQFDGEFLNCGCMAVQPWAEQASVVQRVMQTQPGTDGCLPVILVLNAQRGQTNFDQAKDWLEAAHLKLNQLFRESITGKTREIYPNKEEV